MLKEFALKNFKALEDVSLSLGRITVLIGPNGTGKSSVLQALAVLKQSRDRGYFVTSGPSIDLGTYEDVVHGRLKERHIEYRLSITLTEPNVLRGEVALSYDTRFDQGGLRFHELNVEGRGLAVKAYWNKVTGDSEVRPTEVPFGIGTALLNMRNSIAQPIGVASWDFPPNTDELVREKIQIASQNVFAGIWHFLNATYVVPAMRGFDKPAYPLRDNPVDDFLTIHGPGEQASIVLSTIAMRRELEDAISQFAKRATEVRMRIRILPNKQVAAEAYDGEQTNLVNEGFGANQLMVLLAQLVVAPEDSLLGIEEPEIHLHPRTQAALADIFTKVAVEENKQVLITTHNEHILIGFLAQVAEGKLKPEDLAVYYFDKEGPAVKVERLAVDDKGGLEGGLKGFFEVDIEQAERRLQALLKKSYK